MEAEILTIGDELLLGTVVDTNSAWLGKELAQLGVRAKYKTTVSDDPESIEDALRRALSRADLVIATGGLGATMDDATKKSVAKIFKARLVLNDKVLKSIERHFDHRGTAMPVISTQQALIPQGAKVLENPIGTAPGLLFTHRDTLLFLLPGVPAEMKSMFEADVIPLLKEAVRGKAATFQRTIRTTGLAEAQLAERLARVLKRAHRTQLSFIPTPLGVDLTITATGGYEKLANREIRTVEEEICRELGETVYGKDQETLEQVIGYLLTMKNLSLSVAESCTGGLISDRITNVPGSSKYFKGGVISYSNELKQSGLKVSSKTLKKYGAVSSQAAAEMAEGVRKSCKTDIGVSATGIAGPTGGSEEKPVGLIYLALSTKGGVQEEEHRFSGERRQIKEYSAQAALDMLRRYLLHT